MRLLLPLLLLLVVGCSSSGPTSLRLPAGPDVTVRGTIVEIDREPMAVDSDGVITLRTDERNVNVYIPVQVSMCEAEGLDRFPALAAGASIEVRGQSLAGGGVRPCRSDEHYLRLLGE